MSRIQSIAPAAEGPPSGHALVAYALGLSARGEARTALDNPFDADTPAARAWQDGWLAAPMADAPFNA
jgi:hypothetical protein